jgi:hypothetical protein
MLATLTAGAVLLASALLAFYLSWSYRRLRRRDRAAVMFSRFCRKLERARVGPRAPTEGPIDYANRAAAELPAAAPQIGAITRAYLKARYEPGGGESDIDAFARLVRGFKPQPAR